MVVRKSYTTEPSYDDMCYLARLEERHESCLATYNCFALLFFISFALLCLLHLAARAGARTHDPTIWDGQAR